jgi:hypothetical protein
VRVCSWEIKGRLTDCVADVVVTSLPVPYTSLPIPTVPLSVQADGDPFVCLAVFLLYFP